MFLYYAWYEQVRCFFLSTNGAHKPEGVYNSLKPIQHYAARKSITIDLTIASMLLWLSTKEHFVYGNIYI